MRWEPFSGLHLYMEDVNVVPLLTRKEEEELGRQAYNGDRSAIERLIVSNLRLVVKIAHDFKGFGVPLNDLIAEGNIGLIKAAGKYNPDKGTKFSSYSAIWIKQAIRLARFVNIIPKRFSAFGMTPDFVTKVPGVARS